MERGLIHIYCGDGKGKTTAAIGLSIRAAGSGKRVLFVQFLKKSETSELNILENMRGVTVLRPNGGEEWMDRKADLLVLDEAIGAYNKEVIDRVRLLKFLHEKPEELEVVMTGRNPAEELIDLADYVSEIKKVKHPFDKGVRARIGIEK